jgi:hypothetical protein
MESTHEENIDPETISKLGLQLSDEPVNAQVAPGARVFAYPQIQDVFIMESDLYGNKMPKDSCFLAFKGVHGLIGKHLKVETLKNATPDDIRKMVETNQEG